jgi:thiol-disulfide isomerase/thioredoxin
MIPMRHLAPIRHLVLAVIAAAALAGGMLAYVKFVPGRVPEQVSERQPGLLETVWPDLEGRPATLARWRGQVVAVNFWGSWCPPCREEIPAFVRVHEALHGRGFTVVGIAVEDAGPARSFAEAARVSYPVLVGGFAALAQVRALGNPSGGLPFTVILDRDGKVAATYLGGLDEVRLRRAVEPLL